MRWIALQFLLLGSLNAVAAAQAPKTDLVRAELLADVSSIKPGEPFTVGVRLKLAPHYHVYWINPGDSGQATSVQLKTVPQASIGPIEFPTPSRISIPGGLVNYGYENEVMLLARVTPPVKLDAGKLDVTADVSWLVCSDDECIPGDAKLSMSLPVSNVAAAANVELFKRWRDQVPVAAKPMVEVDAPPSKLNVAISWPGSNESPHSKLEWFPGDNDPLIIKDIVVKPSADGALINARLELMQGQKLSRNTIESVLGYTDAGGNRRGLSLSIPIKASAKAEQGE